MRLLGHREVRKVKEAEPELETGSPAPLFTTALQSLIWNGIGLEKVGGNLEVWTKTSVLMLQMILTQMIWEPHVEKQM